MRDLAGAPRLRVAVAGRVLDGTSAVLACRVQQRLGLPAQCLLTLEPDTGVGPNRDGAATVVAAAGDEIEVQVQGQSGPLFSGKVTGVEHVFGADRTLLQRVHAYDALHALRQRQQVRVLEGLTVLGLARTLVEGTGLSAEGVEGPLLPRTYQHRQSDLQLLLDAAAACGLYPVVDGRVLRLVDLCGAGEPVELGWGESLHSVQVQVATGRGLTGVRADRWDAATATSGTARADDLRARADIPAAGSTSDPDGGREQVLPDGHAPDDALPAARAQAELDRAAMETVSADLVAEGDVRLRPGARVRLRGLTDALDGGYVLAEAIHEVGATGYVVTASTRPPVARPAEVPGGAVATLATVTDVDDPRHGGRVKVRCDAFAGLETTWAPVLTPGAGPGRGLLALPDVDDRVAVLLAGGDLDQVLVLGGLYGSGAPTDPGVAAGRVRRYALSSADGERLVLDDEHGRLVLEHPNGSTVELGRERLRVTAATDLTVEAPGHLLTLRAARVSVEEA